MIVDAPTAAPTADRGVIIVNDPPIDEQAVADSSGGGGDWLFIVLVVIFVLLLVVIVLVFLAVRSQRNRKRGSAQTDAHHDFDLQMFDDGSERMNPMFASTGTPDHGPMTGSFMGKNEGGFNHLKFIVPPSPAKEAVVSRTTDPSNPWAHASNDEIAEAVKVLAARMCAHTKRSQQGSESFIVK